MKFIEITTTKSLKILININNIVLIKEMLNGCIIYLDSSYGAVGDSISIKEDYNSIMNKISERNKFAR